MAIRGSQQTTTEDATVEQILEHGRKRSKKRFWRAVFVVALVVFVGSVSALGVVGYSYLQGQQKYDRISEVAALDFEDVAVAEDLATITVDWGALRAANPSTCAWLIVPGTAINYPVVQGQDNEYYLYHDFDGDAGWLANYGAIFMDHGNNPDWSDPSYFIFGHHMNDGSMFADIAGFEDQARFDECRTVYLLSPKGNFKLRTYALVHCAPDDSIVQTQFKNAKERTEYIQDKMDRSLVTASDAPAAKRIKKTFAFATCDTGSWGRDVLFAYVEDTSVTELEGTIGLATEGEATTGFVEDVNVVG